MERGLPPDGAQPVDRLPYFMRAATLQARMQWDDLITLSDHWAEDEPDNPEAWFMQGQALSRLDRRPEAVQAYEHAVTLNGSFAQAWFHLGEQHLRLGERKEVTRIIERLKPLDPELASELATRGGLSQPSASSP